MKMYCVKWTGLLGDNCRRTVSDVDLPDLLDSLFPLANLTSITEVENHLEGSFQSVRSYSLLN